MTLQIYERDYGAGAYFQSHGGALLPGAPAYLSRSQVAQVLSAIWVGDFCYVLTARQMGKTTLKNMVIAELHKTSGPERVWPVSVDLDRIGTPGALPPDPEQATGNFYYGLLEAIAEGLDIPIEFAQWWQAQSNLSFVQRFSKFLRNVALEHIQTGSIVIFVDEIGAIRNLGADADAFLAAIRSLYNARGDDANFRRLTFVLLGTATPSDLIKDPARTPFNLGRRIVLEDFTLEQAAPWRRYLDHNHPGHGEDILSAVFEWTHGHPALTQRLCAAIDAGRHSLWTGQRVHEWIANSVLPEMIKEIKSDPALSHVERAIAALPDKERQAILQAYQEIHQVYGREGIRDNKVSPQQEYLKMLGLVREENGFLHVRNRLYYRVFDEAWIKSHTPKNLVQTIGAVPIALGSLLMVVLLCVSVVWLGSRLFQRRSAMGPQFDLIDIQEAASPTAIAPGPALTPVLTSPAPALPPGVNLTSQGTPAILSPGEALIYILTVHNTGYTALKNVVVQDTFPADVQVSQDGVMDDGRIIGERQIQWILPDLPAGQTREVRWQGSVSAHTQSEKLTNHPRLSLIDGALTSESITPYTVQIRQPVLTVSKQAPDTAMPGETICYTINVENTGDYVATGIIVTDTIPTYVLYPGNIQGGYIITDSIVWEIPKLLPQERHTLNWEGTVNPEIDLNASSMPFFRISSPVHAQISGRSRIYTDTAFTTLGAIPLALTKTASPSVFPGGTVAFTLTVKNISPLPLYGLEVREAIPDCALSPDIIQPAGTFERADVILWSLEELLPGHTALLRWQGVVCKNLPIGQLGSQSQVKIKDMYQKDIVSSAPIEPLLSLDHATTGIAAGPGQEVRFNLTVKTIGAVQGTTPVSNVIVSAAIPPHMSANASTINAQGVIVGNTVVWKLGNLLKDKTIDLVWSAIIDPAIPRTETQLTSRASVTSDSGQKFEDEATISLLAQSVSLSLSAPDQLWPGLLATFRLHVSNNSDATLYKTAVHNPLPRFITAPGNISHNGAYDSNKATIVWVLERVDPGQTVDLHWQGTVAPNIPTTESHLRNQAEAITASGARAAASSNSVLVFPALTLTKLATDQAGPGNTIHYTLTVKNSGAGPALDVQVQDAISEYLAVDTSAISHNGAIIGDDIVWNIGDLPANTAVQLTWRGVLNLGIPEGLDKLTSQAAVSSMGQAIAQATASTTILHPGITLSMTATPAAAPGETLTYTLQVVNNGDVPLKDIVIVDTLPSQVFTPTTEACGGIRYQDTITWTLEVLGQNESHSITCVLSIDPNLSNGQSLTNQVSVTAWPGVQAYASASTIVTNTTGVVSGNHVGGSSRGIRASSYVAGSVRSNLLAGIASPVCIIPVPNPDLRCPNNPASMVRRSAKES